jgi:hypothetical protein
MKGLLRLYPRAWRDRYGAEMESLIADQPGTVRLAIDLIAGAIDARLHPQLSKADAGTTAGRGETAVTKLLTHCQPHDITTADYKRSAALMIGMTMALAGIHLGLKRAFGGNLAIEAFGISTFPVAVLASSWGTYFKRYSTAARLAIILGFGAIVFLLSLGAESISRVL